MLGEAVVLFPLRKAGWLVCSGSLEGAGDGDRDGEGKEEEQYSRSTLSEQFRVLVTELAHGVDEVDGPQESVLSLL